MRFFLVPPVKICFTFAAEPNIRYAHATSAVAYRKYTKLPKGHALFCGTIPIFATATDSTFVFRISIVLKELNTFLAAPWIIKAMILRAEDVPWARFVVVTQWTIH